MYVPLDKDGYVSGDTPCLEGSMGYVIQAFNRDDQTVRYAWKIPRLLGDSLTENQYVCQLLTAEARHAIRMQNSPAVLAGLGPAGNPFERPLPGLCPHAAPPSRGIVARHYLLVQFGKGKRPRFRTITFEGDQITVHPSRPVILRMDQRPSLSVELRSAFEQRAYAQYIHEPRENNVTDVHIAALVDVSDSEQTKGGWYLKLPSVLYNWAEGTLQEAISEGSRVGWTTYENLLLIQRILTGIRELHIKKLLHGDMRPANIMYIRDPRDPEDYVITDYGSLAAGDADRFGNSNESTTDDRTLFQAITNPRSSQFYAPERRNGYEHEEGDVVLLVPVLSNGMKTATESLSTPDLRGWLLVVGWRNAIDVLKSNFGEDEAAPVSTRRPAKSPPPLPTNTREQHRRPPVGDEASSPRVELEQSALGVLLRSLAESFAASTRPDGTAPAVEREMRLHPGDRVRFREYVFRVRSIDEREVRTRHAHGVTATKLTVMYCDPEFWKVFTERLIIVVTDPAKEFPFKDRVYEELSFPKMVELYRWSQATDIFAVGALALYSLFPRSPQRPSREVEQEFSSLLEILENPAFFRKIWPDLDSTCQMLEETLAEERKRRRAPGEFASRTIQVPRVSRSTLAGNAQLHEPKSIKDLAKDTASSLAQTAPHAYELFRETFSGNVAHFCMFMRFVLACLHRRTSCSKDWDSSQVRFPYCSNRIESTSEQIAADKAIADIRRLLPLLTDERLSSLTLDGSECAQIPRFVDQGKTETIMQNLKLTRELNEAKQARNEADQARKEWHEKVHALQRNLDELEGNSAVDISFFRGQVNYMIDSAKRTVGVLQDSKQTIERVSQQRVEGFFMAASVRQQVQEISSDLRRISSDLDTESARLSELIRLAST